MIITVRIWVMLIALFSIVACGGKGVSSESVSYSSNTNGSSTSGSASSANASDASASSTASASSFDPRALIIVKDYCNGGEYLKDVYTNSSLGNLQTLSSSSVSFSATSSQYYAYDCSEKPVFAYTPPEPVTRGGLDAGQYNVALADDGEIVFWGNTQAMEPPNDMPPVAQVAMGEHFLVLSHTDGTGSILRPSGGLIMDREAVNVSDVVDIAAGSNHALFLSENGSVVAWGSNDQGQANVPPGLNNAVAISAGSGYSLALLRNGEIVHWGDPYIKPPEGLNNVMAIDSKGHNNIAYDADGLIHTWGNQSNQQQLPEGLTKDYGAVQVVAGSSSYLAKLADGSLVRWYRDAYMDLPPWTENTDLTEIALGSGHALARDRYNKLYAWGPDSSYANLLLPSDLMGIDRMADGGSDALLMRGDQVFNLQGDQHIIESPPVSMIKSFQFKYSNFGLLYESGEVYLAALGDAVPSADWPLLQKPDYPVKEMVMGIYSNLFLLNDGRLVQFAFDGVVSPPEDIPGPVKNLVGHQTSVTLENGQLFNWDKPGVSSDISMDAQHIVSYQYHFPGHAAMTASGELLHWNSTIEFLTQEDGSQQRIEEIDSPTLIASGIKKFKFLLDGSIFSLSEAGEIDLWSQVDAGSIPQYMQPPTRLPNISNIAASNDQFYALTESGQLIVWGQAFYYPPNFYKLSTSDGL